MRPLCFPFVFSSPKLAWRRIPPLSFLQIPYDVVMRPVGLAAVEVADNVEMEGQTGLALEAA